MSFSIDDLVYRLDFPLPLRVPVSTKKDFILNLNRYRNAHWTQLNKAKENYKEFIHNRIDESQKIDKDLHLHVRYIIHKGDNKMYDVANFASVISKFTNDALVEAGLISDDNVNVIVSEHYEAGCVVKGGGCAKLSIWCYKRLYPEEFY
jgi:hypothetical protein